MSAKKCEICPRKLGKHGTRFCSRKCGNRGKARRDISGDKNPKWRGGRVSGPGGRILVYAPWHPMATLCGSKYILEYRLIAEKKLGRMLRRNEVVHHINENPHDNSPENLEVMTKSEHTRMHSTGVKHYGVKRDKLGRILPKANKRVEAGAYIKAATVGA